MIMNTINEKLNIDKSDDESGNVKFTESGED